LVRNYEEYSTTYHIKYKADNPNIKDAISCILADTIQCKDENGKAGVTYNPHENGNPINLGINVTRTSALCAFIKEQAKSDSYFDYSGLCVRDINPDSTEYDHPTARDFGSDQIALDEYCEGNSTLAKPIGKLRAERNGDGSETSVELAIRQALNIEDYDHDGRAVRLLRMPLLLVRAPCESIDPLFGPNRVDTFGQLRFATIAIIELRHYALHKSGESMIEPANSNHRTFRFLYDDLGEYINSTNCALNEEQYYDMIDESSMETPVGYLMRYNNESVRKLASYLKTANSRLIDAHKRIDSRYSDLESGKPQLQSLLPVPRLPSSLPSSSSNSREAAEFVQNKRVKMAYAYNNARNGVSRLLF
jgi:hypothetical protein